MIAIGGIGPAELVTMLVFALSLGGASGLPLSTLKVDGDDARQAVLQPEARKLLQREERGPWTLSVCQARYA